jgi:hypothetical protein
MAEPNDWITITGLISIALAVVAATAIILL